jgi:hypothetical protein
MPTPALLSTDTERSWAYQRPGRSIALQKIENEYREEATLTAGSWLRQETTDWSAFDRAAWLTRLSRALPEWAFYYIGPRADINQSDGIPMLLNQGDGLLFLKEGDGGDD